MAGVTSRPSRDGRRSFAGSGRRKITASTGITVTATRNEASRAATTMIEKDRKISLISPPTRPMGRKTAAVARVEEAIAFDTSLVPTRAACLRDSPRSRCL